MARWVCTVAAVVVVGAAVFCLFGTAVYGSVSKDWKTAWMFAVGGGLLEAVQQRGYDQTGWPIHRGWQVERRLAWSWGMAEQGRGQATCRGGFFWSWPDGPLADRYVGVTLLYPFLLTAGPAALLWYSHLRRPRPGQCKSCSYSRLGLAPDAPCPECGRVPAV